MACSEFFISRVCALRVPFFISAPFLSVPLMFFSLAIISCSDPAPPGERDGENLYRNTAPGVGYVGSDRCGSCHVEIYDSFVRSEMGRSMSMPDAAVFSRQGLPVLDSVKNLWYEVVRKDGQLFQREYRIGSDGTIIHERMVPADLVIGSGNNLLMYFHNENGMLYELPLTWYIHRKKWDLSPGYREVENHRFSRFAGERCIACHNAYLERRPDAADRYAEPFTLGIGCERCHGPGELHIAEMMTTSVPIAESRVKNIVNPRKLSSERQLDVCRQCHLQGKAVVLRSGKAWFDFRPGQLLASHRSVYVPSVTEEEVIEVADSPQRMMRSQCYIKSGGALTCITCHNPHRSIKEFTPQHYNNACQSCHEPTSLAQQKLGYQHSVSDNCVDCHMNRTGNENTLHGVSNTDHWIRRDARATPVDWTSLRLPPARRPIIALIPEVDSPDDMQEERKGIAYLDYFKERDTRAQYLDSAEYYLRLNPAGTRSREARLAIAAINMFHQRYENALAEYEAVAKTDTNMVEALEGAARAYSALGKYREATEWYRKAIARRGSEPRFFEGLGDALVNLDSAESAITALERAISLDSQSPHPFVLLGNLYALHLKDLDNALLMYQKAVEINPDIAGGYANIGNIYLLKQEYANAERFYGLELQARPNSIAGLLNMGRLYMVTGRISKAKAILLSALEVEPGLVAARDYLEQMEQ